MYDALEMPKTSGLIPKIRNKELVVEIFTTYVVVRSVQSAYKEYPGIKEKTQEDFSAVLDIKKALLSDACIDWDFFFGSADISGAYVKTILSVLLNSCEYLT